MADEEQKVELEANVVVDGVKNAVNEIKKINKSFSSLDNSIKDVNKNIEKTVESIGDLAKGIGKIDTTPLSEAHSKVQYGKSSFTGNPNNPNDNARLDRLTAKMEELLRQQAINLENTNKFFNDNQKILREQTAAFKKNAITGQKMREPRANYLNARADYLNFKRENPELWAKQRGSWSYEMGNALSQTGSNISKYGVVGSVIGGGMDLIGMALKSPATAFAGALVKATDSVIKFASASIEAYGEIESIKTQLSVVMGSEVQSNKIFGDISQYAIKSPFGIEQTSELATLLKQSGVYATDLMDTLKMLGDTAGGNMEKMKRIANNYAQIVSIGKASMLDMRQFAYAGIPIFEAVSKELGVSQAQLRKLISDGKVTADIVEKVFKDLTGVNGIFENATQKGAETLKARLQNLKDAKQLMFSEFGEAAINYGEKNGGDSYVLNGLSGFEGIYQALRKWGEGINLKRNLDVIASRGGNNHLDEDRTTLNKAFETYTKENNEIKALREKYGLSDDKNGQILAFGSSALHNTAATLNILEWLPNKAVDILSANAANISGVNQLTGFEGTNFSNYSWKNFKENGKDAQLLFKASQNYKEITPEMKRANDEVMTILEQQAGFDTLGKFLGKTGSGYNISSEIMAAMSKTPEAKQKAQNDQLALWKQTIEILRDIYKVQDEEGNVDITKLSASKFLKYAEGGYFSGQKLNVVENKSASVMKQDQAQLIKQYEYANNIIQDMLTNSNLVNKNEIITKLTGISGGLNKTDNAKEFLTSFDDIFNQQSEYLNNLLNNADVSDKKTVELFTQLLTILRTSTLKVSADTSAKDADLNKLKDYLDKSNVFIPLWKRILGGATGISPQVLTSSKQGLDLYKNDMAVRTMASNVFSTVLKEGGSVGDIQSLLKVDGSLKQLRNDNSKTYQIDWVKTREEIKKFSLQLRASTEVINAYKSGLQAEYDTYIKLMSEGITQSETSDIQNAKTMSSKKFGELIKDANEQLVNAFGEELVNGDGIKIADIKDGIAYDANGVRLQNQEIKLTGNLYKVIERELPRIRKELSEANSQEFQNSIFKSMNDPVYESLIKGRVLSSASSNPTILRHLNSFMPQIIQRIDEELKSLGIDKDPRASIVSDYINGKDVVKGSSSTTYLGMAINKTLKSIYGISDIEKLAELLEKIEKNTAIQNNYTHLVGNSNKGALSMLYELSHSKGYSNDNTENSKARRFGSSVIDNLFKGDIFKSIGLDPSVDFKEMTEMGNDNRKKVRETLASYNSGLDINTFGNSLLNLGVSQDQIDNIKQSPEEKRLELLKQISDEYSDINEKELRSQASQEAINMSLAEFGASMLSITKDTGKKAFLAPFETMAECLVTSNDYSGALEKNMSAIAAAMLSQVGTAMANAGFQIAAAAAMEHNWVLAASGLGLAAAGGFASGLGGALNNASSESDKSDDKSQKLESLKDKIAELLEQARKDALYYENNLRHRTALGINATVSKVNDAVITPRGDIISTAPDDYLIATKTPQSLGGSRMSVQVNHTVVNNSSAKIEVRTEENVNADGSVEVVAYIEDVVNGFISSPRSDDAFNARNYRLQGIQSVM